MPLLSRLEKFSKIIPIIYPLLIFLGFYGYHVYYNHFNINIFHYLNVYELVFSFVSYTTSIFVLSLGVIFYFALAFSGGVDEEEDEESEEGENNSFSLIYGNQFEDIEKACISFIDNLKKLRYTKLIGSIISIPFIVALALLKLALWLFFIFYSILLLLILVPSQDRLSTYSFFNGSSFSTFVFGAIWFFIFLAILKNRLDNERINGKAYSFFLYGFTFVFVLGMISAKQRQKIENFYSKDKIANVEFTYSQNRISTDDCLVFIGKTSNYIFFRDMETEFNHIFNLQEVRNLKIRYK